MILVDSRWSGQHGIGRYATEVLQRLTVPWQPLGLDGKPSSPTDFLRLRSLPEGASGIYSPGYNAFAVRAPQVVTVHDLIHLHPSNRKRAPYLAYYNAVLRPVIRRTGVVLTVSETSKTLIERWVKDDSVRVVNAGNGLSSAFVADGPSASLDRPYFLYVGNLRAHKNVDVILKALSRVPDAKLILVIGDAAAARSRAAEFGVADRIDVRSGVSDDEMAALYRGAVATLQPSIVEGFGLPAAESLASGTPVLYWTECASVAEICAGQGGAVSDAHDDVAWAAAMDDAIRVPRDVFPMAALHDWAHTAAVVSETLTGVTV